MNFNYFTLQSAKKSNAKYCNSFIWITSCSRSASRTLKMRELHLFRRQMGRQRLDYDLGITFLSCVTIQTSRANPTTSFRHFTTCKCSLKKSLRKRHSVGQFYLLTLRLRRLIIFFLPRIKKYSRKILCLYFLCQVSWMVFISFFFFNNL